MCEAPISIEASLVGRSGQGFSSAESEEVGLTRHRYAQYSTNLKNTNKYIRTNIYIFKAYIKPI